MCGDVMCLLCSAYNTHSLASSSSSFTDLSNDVSLRDHHHRHKVDDRDQVMVMGKKESTLSFFSPFVLCVAHCFSTGHSLFAYEISIDLHYFHLFTTTIAHN